MCPGIALLQVCLLWLWLYCMTLSWLHTDFHTEQRSPALGGCRTGSISLVGVPFSCVPHGKQDADSRKVSQHLVVSIRLILCKWRNSIALLHLPVLEGLLGRCELAVACHGGGGICGSSQIQIYWANQRFHSGFSVRCYGKIWMNLLATVLVGGLKLHYFGHFMQTADSLEKTLMLGKIEDMRKRERQRMRWLGGITDSMDMSLSKR